MRERGGCSNNRQRGRGGCCGGGPGTLVLAGGSGDLKGRPHDDIEFSELARANRKPFDSLSRTRRANQSSRRYHLPCLRQVFQ